MLDFVRKMCESSGFISPYASDRWQKEMRECAEALTIANREIQESATAYQRLQEQFLQSQKMESIGKLVCGIAHDFNNLMTAILGYTQLAMLHHPEDAALQTDLRHIDGITRRATDLTRQLLIFARKQPTAPHLLDLYDLTCNIFYLLRRLVNDTITITILPSLDLWSVHADPGQMEQVLINLGINASDAMPDGGKLNIELHNVTLEAGAVPQYPEMAAGDYVMLTVSDTGEGIPLDVQVRIFEPFFTTKERGKGTGLGLATCREILSQQRGTIHFHSESGKGTTFTIYLPRAEKR